MSKCVLLPYKYQPILTAQSVKEHANWGVKQFDFSKIWNYTLGEGVKTAVLDTGVDTNHEDLQTCLLNGYNFIDDNDNPYSENEHGTHIAGILSAQHNHLGVIGIAPKSKIVPVKVLDDDGIGDVESIVKGIEFSINEKVDFILLSLGTTEPEPILRHTIRKAKKKGIITFAAAGNMGLSEHLLYPANYPETIAVGAIDSKLKRAVYSNTGNNLDFLAPGDKILSTIPKNKYGILSGSSMANPFACGLAILILSYQKKIQNDFRNNLLYMKDILKSKSIHIENELQSNQGYGIINTDCFFNLVR